MKKLITTTLLLAFAIAIYAQNQRPLPDFSKIIVSPNIEVELVHGDNPSISWEAIGVDEDKVNIKVKNNKLSIYLEDARIVDKGKKSNYGWRYPIYHKSVLVKAKVTYTELKKLEIRGEEQVKLLSELNPEKKFVLKLYGASEVDIAGINAEKFKAVLIGENELTVAAGNTGHQKIKSIGGNSVNFTRLPTNRAKTNTIGQSELSLNVSNNLKVTSIGESRLKVSGHPNIRKGLIIGETRIRD